MKPLFKCQYEWTADDTKAIYYRTMKRTKKIKISFIVLALAFAACCATLFLQDEPKLMYLSGSLLAIITLGIGFVLFKYNRYAKKEYSYLLKCNGGKAPELFIEVNDSVISSKNRKGLGSKISFDSIIYAAEDKRRFMLTSSDGKHFILKKDGFTRGSVEEFKAFLREKELMI